MTMWQILIQVGFVRTLPIEVIHMKQDYKIRSCTSQVLCYLDHLPIRSPVEGHAHVLPERSITPLELLSSQVKPR